jgi:V/A-type H+/Na+-transporting ATPase subunit I
MRIDVHKYLMMGPSSKRPLFYKEAQQLGCVQFQGSKRVEPSQDVQLFIDALHVLRKMVPKKEATPAEIYAPNVMARQIVDHNERLERLQEEERILQKEIDRILPLGEFSLDQVHKIEESTGWKLQFFCCKQGKVDYFTLDNLFKITSHAEMDYFFSLSPKKRVIEGMIELKLSKGLDDLYTQLAQLHREMDQHEGELSSLSYHKNLLQKGLRKALNQYDLEEALGYAQFPVEGRLFAAEAWVPDNKLDEVKLLAEKYSVAMDQIQVEEEDRPPTYLENKGAAKLGEDLIDIYDTPATTDRDPSLWVFGAFSIFFSMIVADVGYGLILLGIAGYFLWKLKPQKGMLKRFLTLTLCLAAGCIFWGTMVCSFFGLDVPPDNPIRDISIIHWMVLKKAEYFIQMKPTGYLDLLKQYPQLGGISNPLQFLMGAKSTAPGGNPFPLYVEFTRNVLIELSLFIGVIHIALSFFRYLDRHWAGLGWIISMIGGYLFFTTYIHAISLIHYVFGVPYEGGAEIGKYLLIGGVSFAVIVAIIQHRAAGFGEIAQVIGIFADIMSYLRIYALSLAGMIMGSTFDEIGFGLPIYLGIFVIIAGHLVNFTLALMGGVIHGLRLNFIEWYHYSFEGGGVKFSPLFLRKEN